MSSRRLNGTHEAISRCRSLKLPSSRGSMTAISSPVRNRSRNTAAAILPIAIAVSPLGPRPSRPHAGETPALLFRLPEFSADVKVPPRDALIGGGRDVRRKTRAPATDAGAAAFLGRRAGRRIAPAALHRLRKGVFPAPAVLPRLRGARRRRVRRERQGPAL